MNSLNISKQDYSMLNDSADCEHNITTIPFDAKETLSENLEKSFKLDEVFTNSPQQNDDLMGMSPVNRDRRAPDKRSIQHDRGDLLTGGGDDDANNCSQLAMDVSMAEDFKTEELFKDPSTFEFLMKCTENNNYSRKSIFEGKDSLFIKFDPLFAKKKDVLNTSLPILNERREELSGDSIASPSSMYDYYDGGSNISSLVEQHDPSTNQAQSLSGYQMNKDKPTQMVTPALKSFRTPPKLVRSVSAFSTLPVVATDRLINIKGSPYERAHTPPPPRDSQSIDRLHSVKNILHQQEAEAAELRLENKELKWKVSDQELQLRRLSQENEELIKKEKNLNHKLVEKNINNKQMSVVMEEYERTISSMIGEHQTEKKTWTETKEKLIMERDQALNHLFSMESSFNDIHMKYERCKSVIQGYKSNEDAYKETEEENKATISKLENLYATLKQHATEQLNTANQQQETTQKAHNLEVTKLNATIKKLEIKVSSLQDSLNLKIKDNEELTAICDELINKVG